MLAGAHVLAEALAAAARDREFRFARGPIDMQRVHRLARAVERFFGGGALEGGALRLDGQVVPLDVELAELFTDARAGSGGMLHRVAQRGGRIDRGIDLAARGLDVRLEPFDRPIGERVRLFLGGEGLGRVLALTDGACRRGAALLELERGRRPARLERLDLRAHHQRRGAERFHLLLVEGDLLLQPTDRQLARVRRFARPGRPAVRFGQLEAEPLQRRLDFRQVAGGRGLTRARVGQPAARRFDRLAQQPVAPRELDLLPPPQLFAQALVAPRLGRLPLQRPALLLDLEDDVVDARQVLLRRFELQLGGAAARLVFRDARRFLDQLPAIGGARAQDLPDLPLLDHRVRHHPDARVHQQILDVLQAHDFAVDQVFAFTRPVEPARQLDVTHDQRLFFDGQRRRQGIAAEQLAGGGRDHGFARRERFRFHRAVARHARRHPAQSQPHFRGGGRLPGIAALENDVLHVLAAQALCALLAKHPGNRVNHVALAAAVRPDDGGDAGVEGELGPVSEALEPGDFETIQTHMDDPGRPRTDHGAEAAGNASKREVFGIRRLDNGRYIPSTQHPAQRGVAPEAGERRSV